MLEAFGTPGAYDAGFLRPLGQVVRNMEYRGVPIDMDRAAELEGVFASRLRETSGNLDAWLDSVGWPDPHFSGNDPGERVNWNSHDQLGLLFHSPLGLDVPPSPYKKKGLVDVGPDWRTVDGEYTMDDRALEYLSGAHPEHRAGIGLLRKYKKEERMGRYLRDWQEMAVKHGDGTWRLHPSYGLSSDNDDRSGAASGRFAIKNPAINQVPSRGEYGGLMRSVFAAPPGKRLIVRDYSGLEMVVLAHICFRLFGTTGMVERVARGAPDIHSLTARFVFREVMKDPLAPEDLAAYKVKGSYAAGLRDLIKAIRYGLNYGKGTYGFGNTLFDAAGNPLGEDRAGDMMAALFQMDPEIQMYQEFVRAFITRFRAIPSLLGRWLHLPLATSPKQRDRNRAWRQALNDPMQAGGQEVTGMAMIRIENDPRWVALGAELILPVHDELIALVGDQEAEEASQLQGWHMEHALELDAELQAPGHHAQRWNEAKG